MPDDSGISRSISLPDLPQWHPDPQVMIKRLFDHVYRLNDALAAAHDDVAERVNEFLIFQEWQENTHDPVTADQNNYNLGIDGIVHRFTLDTPHQITGFLAPLVARFVILLNVGAQTLSIPHQSASSDAANRVITAAGTTLAIAGAQSVALWYDLDPTVLRWRQLTL